jgi:hypothetical protein
VAPDKLKAAVKAKAMLPHVEAVREARDARGYVEEARLGSPLAALGFECGSLGNVSERRKEADIEEFG